MANTSENIVLNLRQAFSALKLFIRPLVASIAFLFAVDFIGSLLFGSFLRETLISVSEKRPISYDIPKIFLNIFYIYLYEIVRILTVVGWLLAVRKNNQDSFIALPSVAVFSKIVPLFMIVSMGFILILFSAVFLSFAIVGFPSLGYFFMFICFFILAVRVSPAFAVPVFKQNKTALEALKLSFKATKRIETSLTIFAIFICSYAVALLGGILLSRIFYFIFSTDEMKSFVSSLFSSSLSSIAMFFFMGFVYYFMLHSQKKDITV